MKKFLLLVFMLGIAFAKPYQMGLWEVHALTIDRLQSKELYHELKKSLKETQFFELVDYEDISRAWYEENQELLPRCADIECFKEVFAKSKLHWILSAEINRNHSYYLIEFKLYSSKESQVVYRENYQIPRDPPYAFSELSRYVVRKYFGYENQQKELPENLFLKPVESYQSPWLSALTTALAGGISYWQSIPRKFSKSEVITPAQELSQDYSAAPTHFSRPSPSARILALGNAGTSLAEDGAAVAWNPANLAVLSHTQWKLSQVREKQSPQSLHGYYKSSYNKYMAYGFSMQTSQDNLYKYWYFQSGWGWQLEQIHDLLYGNSFGFSVKSYGVKVGSACNTPECVRGGTFGWGLDLGWSSLLSPGIVFGIVWQDIYREEAHYNARTQDSYKERLPSVFRFGTRLESWREWTFTADMDLFSFEENIHRIGAGMEKTWGWVVLRTGMEQLQSPIGAQFNASGGLGFTLNRKSWEISFDYGFSLPLGDERFSTGTQIFDLNWSY